MNKLKDFFYNKNDIIIVLIILIAAGLIIYTRIDTIMAYPEKLAEKAALQQKIEATAEENTAETVSPAAASNSNAAEIVTITVSDSDTSATVASKLYNVGAASSAEEFENYINSQGKGNSLKSGTFQIPKGSSNEEILKIIAN